MRARTDVEAAEAQVDLAEAQVAVVEGHRDNAEQAMMDAATAETNAKASTSADDAKKYRDMAKEANDKATAAHGAPESMELEDAEVGAAKSLLDARTAAEAAETAAGTHVIPLFMQANAYDITDPMRDMDEDTITMTVAELRETERNAVGMAIADAANAANGDADGGVSATVDWPPTAEDPTLAVAGLTNGDTATAATTRETPGLGRFTLGFRHVLPPTDTDAANSQVLVFSNKEKEVAPVTALPARNVVNIAVTPANVRSLTPAAGTSFSGTYDDDGSADTPVLTGTFNCTGENCTLDYTTDAAGMVSVTAATGYTFTGNRPARAAVTEDTQEDYLVFGIWLSEDTNGADTFGAIYGGGTDYAANVGNVITGTATYTGSAFGAHHKTNEAVSFFDGRATLMADFGADNAPGTVEGSIDQIQVGGDDYGDVIRLVRTNLTDGVATFNGSAVMGPQTAPGQASHAYNGTYSGSFFAASAAVVDDPATTEDETRAAGASAPGAVAGSFGVTRSQTTGTGDDAMTTVESFIGAFGAHKE